MKEQAFMGGDGISDQEFITVAGPAADGTYYSVAAPDATKLPSANAFVDAYRKKYNAPVGPYSANAFAAAQVAIAAIEKAVKSGNGALPTRAEVLRNVAATKGLATPIGTIGFDKAGDTTAPILTLVEVVSGKPKTIDQIVVTGS
jgi:branched-chain amino acid transport system substrate-binding protein